MIRNIIFDAEDVLYEFDRIELMDQCGATAYDFEILEKEIFYKAEPLLNAGIINKKEAIKMSCESLVNRDCRFLLPICLEIYDKWYDFVQINDSMIELLSSLRETGYKCYILSNGTPQLLTMVSNIKNKRGKASLFNDYVFSYELGLLKPSLSIFQKFCKRDHLEPRECLYVDIDGRNLEIASNIGMECYNFSNSEVFKKYLIENGMILY